MTDFKCLGKSQRPGFVIGLIVLATLANGFASDLSVKAFVDKAVVGMGDRFTLSLQLSGAEAGDVSEPSPPEMESFGRYLGNGTSRSIQIVNGQMSSTRTINYYFQALAPGNFEIDPIVLTHEGIEYRTNPIQVEIVERRTSGSRSRAQQTQGLSSRDLFLRASVSRTRVFQNEAILLNYKIYTRVNVTGYSITTVPDKTGFWVEDLLKDQQQPSTSTEVIDGLQYTVATLQSVILFPTGPGTKTLEPLEVECEVRVRQNRRGLFDDFFSDPFGRSVRYSIRSEQVTIEARPLPGEGRPKGFAGAVGEFRLSGGVDKSTVNANEVVTLKLKLEGSGNIRTLPSPTTSFSSGLENYDPKVSEVVRVSGSQVKGSRTYEYVLVPRTSGTEKVHAIEFPYFDPVDEVYKTASLPEISIEVTPGSQSMGQGVETSLAKEDVRLLAQEIRFIKLDPGKLRGIDYAVHKNALFWSIALLPLLGVLVGFWYRRHQNRLQGDRGYARSRQAGRLARKRLATARTLLPKLEHREFYAECGKALQGFAADKLNIPEAGIISDNLAQLLKTGGVSDSVTGEYLACMKTCDLKRFSPVDSGKDEMSAFLKRAEEAIKNLHKELSR